jgi:DNA sulfur modification protein DndE
MLPNRISLSQNATNKLQKMKSHTGLTPNVLSRIAIMLTLKEANNLSTAGILDYDGQTLDKTVLFGEYTDVYDVMINQYLFDNNLTLPVKYAIATMVEVGLYKMGHIKKLSDVCKLK